ncbi:hypothetical protein K491DRAFT_612804, partial [Lophiostoma macrostomum CBS 122681]
PHGRERAIRNSKNLFLQAHHADPTGHWLKVTNTETGEIVGGCRWHIHKTNPYHQHEDDGKQVDAATQKPYEAPTYEESMEKEFASLILGQVLNPRARRYVRPHTHFANNLFDLHICFVHPSYRNRGIGRTLAAWGVEKADDMRVESFLEATDMGRELYQKLGFVVVSIEEADASRQGLDEEWEELRRKFLPYHWHCMWRPVAGVFEQGVTKLPW